MLIHFLFILQMYLHKNISLYKKNFIFFFHLWTLLWDSFPPQLHKLLKSRFFFRRNPLGAQQDTGSCFVGATQMLFRRYDMSLSPI